MASIPEVPSVHETLAGFENLGWIILFAQAAAPPANLDALADAWAQGRTQPGARERLKMLGIYPPARYGTRASLLALLKVERERTAQLVKRLNIRAV
jgi:tripartite-type tricarboxylate transporter receptor subunit TctC